MPEDMAGVVVAVGAERLADDRNVLGMDGSAAEPTAVLAGAAPAARSTDSPCPVDGSEGRSGQGNEEPGSVADGSRDVLAAEEARADEVEGVSGMEARAGQADSCTSVAAADEKAFAGLGAGVVVVEDLAGCGVQGGGRAGEVDGVGAAAGCGDLLQPARELGILGDADCVAVCFGELTQARRAGKDGAPVSRGELRGDGGDLPGWAAEAARWLGGGAPLVMGVTPLRASGR